MELFRDTPLPTDDKGNLWVADKGLGACLLAKTGPDRYQMITYVDAPKLHPEQYALTEHVISKRSTAEKASIQRMREHLKSLSNSESFNMNISSVRFGHNRHLPKPRARVA
jgi:hypothetical protein